MERTVLTKKTAGNRCGFICGLLFVFASLHLATNVNAQGVGQQYVPVFNQDSECVFLLDFDGIPQQQQVVVAEAAKYWVNILKATGKMPVDPVTGEPQPVVINIFPMNVANNAGAASNGMVLSDNSLAPDRFNTVTKPQALIADGFCSEELSSPYFVDANGNYFGDGLNPHAFIGIGTGWASSTDPVDVSGRVMNDLLPVIIHEIGHALGITNDVREGVDADTGTWEYVFPEQVSRWGSRLRDANGKIAKPGLIIQHPDEFADPDKYFDIGDSRIKIDSNSNLVIHDPNEEIPVPTFVGKNALELWYGKSIDKMTAEELNRGVPIQGLLDNSGIWMFSTGGVLSHIDTTNSLMSWQEYRNYNGFIEIELATLQDIGYAVERRDFFGKSYYQDGNGYFDTKTGKWNYGTQVVNANGFSKWNYGTASYSGEPNQNNFAIGAHLFANNLNVLQTGDIFADGPGSAGVRIDGQNNQLTIDKNTVIITNGINGDGVVAAYGSNHNIIHQGYIEASNYGGKGISFNFGIPLIGDVRGSYSWITIRGTNNAIIATELIPELQGPLVNNLDITGTIIGDSVRSRATYGYADEDSGNNLQLRKEFDLGAAIYIDQTAHLQNLNIMNGAVIKGDIISYWTGPDWMVNNVNRSGSWTAPNGYPTVSAANPSRSEYNYQMGTMQTNLTFGLKAAEDGSATETVDPNFYIKYDGNINYFRYELYPATVSNWNPDDGTYSTTIQILNPDGETYSPYNQIEYDPYDPATWDVSWKNLMRADGFYYVSGATTQNTTNLDFKYFTIERDLANDKVYAGVATPGIIDLRFAAGTTELVGSKVYARNATVDAGATLVLTTDSTRAYSVLDPRSVEYGEYDGSPEIHVGTSWNDTDYNKGGTLTSKDTIIQWDQTSYPFPYGYTELMLDPAAKDKDAAYNDSTRFFTNNGRITGNGSFFVGGMTNSLSSRDGILVGTTTGTGFLGAIDRSGITYYSGTFINNGTLAPGADDGKYVGTIKIFGDLRLNPTSVYEMTLSRQLRTDSDGYPTDEDGNYIRPNGDVIDSAGNLVYDSVYNEATHLFQDVRRKRDPAYVESNDKLIVSGETRLGGTLQIDVAPGSKFDSVRSTYTVIESGLFTPGSRFDSVVSSAAFLTFLPELEFVQYRNSVHAQLTVIRDIEYFARFASGKTYNQIAVANALDSSLGYDSELGFTLGHQNNSAETMLGLYDQFGATIRANSIMMNLWNPAEMVFNHIGYGNGQMETGGRGGINWRRIHERRAKMLGQDCTPNRAGSLWGNFFHTAFEAAADGNSAAYKYDRNGFTVGAEMNITPYAALGFNIAYSNNKLNQGIDKADSDDYQLGLYLVAAPFNEFEIKSYLGMGIQEYDIDRRIQSPDFVGNIYNYNTLKWDTCTGINERYKSKANGNSFNYSLELARPVALHPTLIVRPTLGIDVYYITQGRFGDEEDPNGTNLYRLNYSGTNLDRTLLRAGFSTETSGCRGGLRLRTFYVSNIGGDLYPASKASFAAGSDTFKVLGTSVGKNYLNLGLSGNLYLDGARTSSFFVDYDANLYNTSRKIQNHSFNIGFIQNF